jgi:flagellum-specific peptidoglycan hydrolase FlgJ/LysM repeat protein
MKQKTVAHSAFARPAIFSMMIAVLFTACDPSKRASQTPRGKVPTDYGTTAAGITNQQARLNYVDRFKGIAVREMERTGVPASIKLAQGLLESDAGRSTLANQANNHFGIKCHSGWQGQSYYKEDDDYDPVTKQLIKSCFRVYQNADQSFMEHSEFLRDPRKVNRYGWLFQLPKNDYVAWANGLEKSGYATATDYSEKLIKLIEDYQLAQFDGYTSAEVPLPGTKPSGTRPADNFPVSGNPTYTPPSSGSNNKPTYGTTDPNQLPYFDPNNPSGSGSTPSNPQNGNYQNGNNGSYVAPLADMVGVRNDVKYVRASGGQSLYEVAGKYGVRVADLQTYNEEIGDPNRPLEHGLVLYTQKKRNRWRGAERTYTVKDCETMYDIAQKYGIKLSKLYSKNEMRDGEQPQIGEKLLLRRGWFQGADKPALRDTFGEWRRCKIPVIGKPMLPAPVSRPGTNPNNVFNTDITPTGTGQPTTPSGYPPPVPQPTYSPSNYPTTTTTEYPTTTTYPTTGTVEYPTTTTTYPTTGTVEYPTTTTTYPTTTPTTTYPSYPTYPSKPSTTRPSTPAPVKPKPIPTPVNPQPTATGAAQYYTVQPKETLWGISQKFKTTVDALKKLNNMADNNLKIGQQIRVK